jgi:CYTH domain-containing protein
MNWSHDVWVIGSLLAISPNLYGQEAGQVWAAMELAPLQARMTAINEWVGVDVTRFNPFTVGSTGS